VILPSSASKKAVLSPLTEQINNEPRDFPSFWRIHIDDIPEISIGKLGLYVAEETKDLQADLSLTTQGLRQYEAFRARDKEIRILI